MASTESSSTADSSAENALTAEDTLIALSPHASGSASAHANNELPNGDSAAMKTRNTQLAFGNAGLKLEKQATLNASCDDPTSTVAQVEQLAVAHKGYVLSSILQKVVLDQQQGRNAKGDSTISKELNRLTATLTLAVPNAEFEATMSALSGLPIKVTARQVSQRDQTASMKEEQLKRDLASKQADAAGDMAKTASAKRTQTELLERQQQAEARALDNALNLERLDKKVQWSVINLEITGKDQVETIKAPNLNALLEKETGGNNWGNWLGYIGSLLAGIGIGLFVGRRK